MGWNLPGNEELMGREKISFLSSRRVTPEGVLGAYEWARGIREDPSACVIGGWQSGLERDVLQLLLRGHCGIVLVEAKKHPRKTIPSLCREAFQAGRLLYVTLPGETTDRIGAASAARRNRYILSHSSRHVFGTLSPDGLLAPLVSSLPSSTLLVLG